MLLFRRQKHLVKLVKNTNVRYKTESPEYLLVKEYRQAPLLFTKAEVARARKRAEKNPEDTR